MSNAALRFMSASIPHSVEDSTVAIVGSSGSLVRQLGTGTLFRIADRSFVVTAAHVVSHAHKTESTLGISGGSDKRFIATCGPRSWVCSGESAENYEPFDLAFSELNDDQVKRLDTKRFLRLSDVDFAEDTSHGFFVICGFPNIWTSTCDGYADTMALKALQFASFAFEGHTTGLLGFDSRYHFLLDAKNEALFDHFGECIDFRMRSGHRARFPNDLSGVSGCSVWKIGDLRQSVDRWRASRARLVGIQTSVYQRPGILKVTRWACASTLFYLAVPDLRHAIEISDAR